MRRVLICCIFLLLSVCVNAISLSIPHEKEVILTPGEHSYSFSVSGQETTPVRLFVNAGSLELFSDLSINEAMVEESKILKFTLDLNIPDTLPPGVYPVTVEIKEKKKSTGAFEANIGVSHTMLFVKPYPEGKPYITLKSHSSVPSPGEVNVGVEVWNVGNTPLDAEPVFTLENENTVIQVVTSDSVIVEPFEKEIIKAKLDAPKIGYYVVSASLANEKEQKKLAVGKPLVTLLQTPKASERAFSLNLPIRLDWDRPLPNANVEISVLEGKRLIFSASNRNLDLMPGMNNVSMRGYMFKSVIGEHSGHLTVLSDPHFIKIPITGIVEKHVKTRPKTTTQYFDYTYEEEILDNSKTGASFVPTPQEKEKKSKLTTILVLLAIAAALLAFVIGMKKHEH